MLTYFSFMFFLEFLFYSAWSISLKLILNLDFALEHKSPL